MALGVLLLEGRDVIVMAERQADIVDTVQQPVLVEGIDFEAVVLLVRPRYRLRLQAESNLGPGDSRNCRRSVLQSSSDRRTGRMPCLVQLL